MTAIKNSYLLKYIIHRLSRSKTLVTLSFVFGGLAFVAPMLVPLVWAVQSRGVYTFDRILSNMPYNYSQIESMLVVFAVLSVFALGVLCFVAPAICNKHYNDKSCADMYYSLPLKHGGRFVGDLLSGINAVLLPAFLCAAAGYFLYCLILVIDNAKAYVPTDIGLYIGLGAKVLINIFLIYLSFCIFSYFISVCCGRAGAAIIRAFVAAIALPCITGIITFSFYHRATGVDVMGTVWSAISTMPPLGVFVGIILNLDQVGQIEQLDRCLPTHNIEVWLPMLIWAVILIVGAYFLLKIRKPEKAENPYVFPAVYHIITLMPIVFFIGLGVFLSESVGGQYDTTAPVFIFGAILITFIIYFISEAIRHSGFTRLKDVGVSVLRYAVCAVVSVGFFSIAGYADGFGARTYVPQASKIKSVQIASDFADFVDIKSYWYYSTDEYPIPAFESAEDIEIITDLHKTIIESDSLTGTDLTISYTLNDGSNVKRTYRFISQEAARKVCYRLSETQVYRERMLEFIGRQEYSCEITAFDQKTKKGYVIGKDDGKKLLSAFAEEYALYGGERRQTVANMKVALWDSEGTDNCDIYIDERYSKTLDILNYCFSDSADSILMEDIDECVDYSALNDGFRDVFYISYGKYEEEVDCLIDLAKPLDFNMPFHADYITIEFDGIGGYYIPAENYEEAEKLIDKIRYGYSPSA